MMKRLLNLNTIQNITLILTTFLLLPNTALAQDTYTYGSGIALRYNDGLNQYSHEFDYIWKVSLTGTNPSSNSDGFTNFDELKLTFQEPLKGEISDVALTASITSDSNVDIKVYKLTAPEADTRTQIGTIEIKGGETTTYEYHALNNENNVFDNEYIQIAFEKKDPNNATSISTGAIEGIILKFKGKSFGIKVDGKRVTSDNKNDILGDGNGGTGSVSFDGEETLILNNAHLTRGIRTTIKALKINISGTNTINTTDSTTIKSWLETHDSQLTFCSSDASSTLTIIPQSNGRAFEGYNVEFDNNLVAVGNYNNEGETITIEKGYDIWIGNYRFSPSKRNGGFSGDINYDDNTHTLSLGGISYSAEIKSCLPELIVKIKNSNTLSKFTFDDEYASGVNGTIIFEKYDNTSDTYQLTLNNDISGFKNISFRDGLGKREEIGNETISYIIEPMTAPRIFSDGGFGISSDEGFEGEIIYSVDYDGTENDITNATYEEETLEMNPCTITAFIRNSESNTSPTVTAKFFGFAESKISVPYQASVAIPDIFPELPDGVSVTYAAQETNTADNTIDSENKKINIFGITKEGNPDGYSAEFSAPTDADYTILNEAASFSTGGPATSYVIDPFLLTVTKKSLEDVAIEDIPDQPFTGAEITPEVVIKNGELVVTNDDCKIAYCDNTNVGTATVTITPTETSFYSGSATKTFKITALSIADATVTLENGTAFTYNEAKNVPTIESVILTIGTSTPDKPAPTISLTAETDYTVSYTKGSEAVDAANIINAGEYKMVLTGKGNFTGTKEVAFTINPRPIESITFTLSTTSFTYNAQAQKPTVTLQFDDAGTTKTIPATDYDLTYSGECINVGTYSVSASLKGNYSGSADGPSFTITKATITPTVTLEGWTYGATANEPGVTGNSGSGVVSYAYKLQHAAEEAYSATKPTNAGAYTVKASIAATANYEAATDSAHFTIAKAAGGLAYSAATASAELNGDGWTAPELKNPNSLAVTYTSSNTAVATISETGVVTLVGTGETTIKAASEGDANHEACEVQYTLTVSRGRALGYGVWVGETEVDEDNYIDILNDGEKDDDGEYTKAPSFIFNPKDTTLLIINSDAGMTIESRLPELKIHLSNDNKLKKIFFNNQGNSENTGKLLFTCDSNFPGSVTIGNTVGESAISGFASVSYEFNLQVLKPAKAKYANGQMTDSLGVVADTITVGVPLEPIKSDDKEELDSDDFTVTNSDGSTATLDLTSANVNNIYYTLPESTEGQGYDPETNTISVVDPMTDDAVEQIAAATTNKNATVGTSEYAESFVGLTFIVQGGEGVIRIDQETEEGYEFHLKIGDKPSIALKSGKEEIEYSLPDATYCWLYLVRKVALARGYTRVSKRDRAPGNVRLVKVQSKVVASTKSAAAASGGTVTPTANLAITGIVEIEKDTPENKYNVETVNDKWYTIDGRRIDKPTQKGLYIRNRKKIVVK